MHAIRGEILPYLLSWVAIPGLLASVVAIALLGDVVRERWRATVLATIGVSLLLVGLIGSLQNPRGSEPIASDGDTDVLLVADQ